VAISTAETSSSRIWPRLLRGHVKAAQEQEFTEFATVAGPRLCRAAYLMCHDWYLAQDMTQNTLAKMYVNWKRLSGTVNLEAYSRTVLIRSLIDQKRRRSGQEMPASEIPQSASTDGVRSELRLTLIDALAYLPPRDRAIIVLRYWEDQSVETVAEALGVSTSVVKKQGTRSLARLRELLGDARADLLADELT
jgi:RNA polymerase sigma-70 factor (sigma-E family)